MSRYSSRRKSKVAFTSLVSQGVLTRLCRWLLGGDAGRHWTIFMIPALAPGAEHVSSNKKNASFPLSRVSMQRAASGDQGLRLARSRVSALGDLKSRHGDVTRSRRRLRGCIAGGPTPSLCARGFPWGSGALHDHIGPDEGQMDITS